jgi:hypothetical protein
MSPSPPALVAAALLACSIQTPPTADIADPPPVLDRQPEPHPHGYVVSERDFPPLAPGAGIWLGELTLTAPLPISR